MSTYFREINKRKQLSRAEESALAERIQAGDESAVQELVKSNLLIVVTIANRHIGQGVPVADLIQEGNIGLLSAARKFKPNSKARFISYAQLWIRKALNEKVVAHGRIVKLPHNQEYDIYKAKVRGEEYTTIQKVELDSPIGEDGDATLGDVLLSNQPDIDHSVEREHQLYLTGRLLSSLKSRDREIVKAYFGIEGYCEIPRDVLAEQHGLTVTRVNQIIKTAVSTMKERAKHLSR